MPKWNFKGNCTSPLKRITQDKENWSLFSILFHQIAFSKGINSKELQPACTSELEKTKYRPNEAKKKDPAASLQEDACIKFCLVFQT